MECVLDVAALVLGAGAVDLAGGKVVHLGVFAEVLRDSQRFLAVAWSRVDKVYKV